MLFKYYSYIGTDDVYGSKNPWIVTGKWDKQYLILIGRDDYILRMTPGYFENNFVPWVDKSLSKD